MPSADVDCVVLILLLPANEYKHCSRVLLVLTHSKDAQQQINHQEQTKADAL